MNSTDPFEIERQRERERFEKAKKIRWDEWDGPVYCDGTGDEGYHENKVLFLHWWDDFGRNLAPPPPYVWACRSTRFAQVDYQRLLDEMAENCCGGYDEKMLHGRKELKAAIDNFNEANKQLVRWDVDLSTAILLENGGAE